MPLKYGSNNDPYCYEGTEVLLNKINIKESSLLENAEREITSFTANEIDFSPAPYDLTYWRSIHKTLFIDLYEWAGEIRTVFITKKETQFCNPQFIEQEANRHFKILAKDNYYVGYSREVLIEKSAELFAELNLIHPFREGNGRTQRILFEHIFANCGYQIDWSSVSVDEWIAANIAGVYMDYSLLALIFDKALFKD